MSIQFNSRRAIRIVELVFFPRVSRGLLIGQNNDPWPPIGSIQRRLPRTFFLYESNSQKFDVLIRNNLMETQTSTTALFGSQFLYPSSSADSDDLSTVRNDLTTLYDESDLTGAHTSRTTQTGFRLDDKRL